MSLNNWREITTSVLADKIGPVATLVVNDLAEELGIDDSSINQANYAKLLIRLSGELPGNIDSVDICRQCREQVA